MGNMTEAAKIAVKAFETDSIGTWLQHLQVAPHCDESELGKLLLKLREAWWHNGTYRQRERVHVLVAKIRHKLQWDAEQSGMTVERCTCKQHRTDGIQATEPDCPIHFESMLHQIRAARQVDNGDKHG